MQFGVLFFSCMFIMLVFGMRIPAEMKVGRAELIMFCVSVLVLNQFIVNIVPELQIMPSCVAIVLFLLGMCIKNNEFDAVKIAAYGGTTLIIMIGLSLLLMPKYAEVIGIAGIIMPLLTQKKLYISLFCATCCAFLCYAVLVLVNVTDYTSYIFNARTILDIQAASILSVFFSWQLALQNKVQTQPEASGD